MRTAGRRFRGPSENGAHRPSSALHMRPICNTLCTAFCVQSVTPVSQLLVSSAHCKSSFLPSTVTVSLKDPVIALFATHGLQHAAPPCSAFSLTHLWGRMVRCVRAVRNLGRFLLGFWHHLWHHLPRSPARTFGKGHPSSLYSDAFLGCLLCFPLIPSDLISHSPWISVLGMVGTCSGWSRES